MKHYLYTSLILAGWATTSIVAQSTKPNIVLIITDQQRADLCGREGFPLPVTPYADSLATQSVWFNKAYTSAPASAPARCSLLSGRYPSATHVRTNHNIPDVYYEKDMLDMLKENGYHTALIGKTIHIGKQIRHLIISLDTDIVVKINRKQAMKKHLPNS